MDDRNTQTLAAGNKPSKLIAFAAVVVIALCLIQMPYLLASSFTQTTDEVAMLYQYYSYADKLLFNIVTALIGLPAVYMLSLLLKRVRLKPLFIVLMTGVAAFCIYAIVTVRLSPGIDPGLVARIAILSAKGDYGAIGSSYIYSGFSLATYLEIFPFQLGFIQYEELIFRLAFAVGLSDTYACILLQGINVLWLLLGYYCVVETVLRLFKSEDAAKLAAILLAACIPGHLFCVYMYGIVPGFALSALAVLLFLRYIDTGKLVYAASYTVAMLLAVWMKHNFLIFFIAVSIVWAFHFLRKLELRQLLCLIGSSAMIICLVDAPVWRYERRSGAEVGRGTPLIYGITIGLAPDASSPGTTGGGVSFQRFLELDESAFNEECADYISDRLQQYKEDPAFARKYFSEKYRTMWNNPTFDSLWICLYGGENYSGAGGLLNFLRGDGYSAFSGYMDWLQRMVFIGYTIALIALIKARELKKCIFPLVILGGTMFHLIYESPSRSMLQYYILMCALAAYGYTWAFSCLENYRKKHRGTT